MTLGALVTLLVAIVFTGLVVWVVLPRNRSRLERHGEIPFDDRGEDR
jgi:cbb3-type cytochrome oxidase subunit 3